MTQILIKSGQWSVRSREYTIYTDLGSCVALCLWDAKQRLGGMNHYLLPGSENDISENPSTGHYANKALLYEMLRKGAALKDIQGAIIGGGVLHPGHDYFGIGEGNIEAAKFILAKHRIPVGYKRVGGNVSRSVELDIEQGSIHVREIQMGAGTVAHYRHQFRDR